jgi:hypothetical protein
MLFTRAFHFCPHLRFHSYPLERFFLVCLIRFNTRMCWTARSFYLFILSSRKRLWGPFNSSQHADVLCRIIHLSFVAHHPINSSTVPPPLLHLFDNLVNPSSTSTTLLHLLQLFDNSVDLTSTSTIPPLLTQLVYPPERASPPGPVDIESARLLLHPLMTRTSPWQMSPSR